ncbi:MAG: DNA alkylation repair protein [Capnocytophaga sp.]|nr:DNA alkylation repair protein [Capnocytophaga sp.]
MNASQIIKILKELASEEKALFLPKFFKTGKGEYGEGDLFLGVVVPEQRQVAKEYYNKVSLRDLEELLGSPYHEIRLTAFLILVLLYEKNTSQRHELCDFYLEHLYAANNWDLVDSTAYKILGKHCYDTDNVQPMYELANSKIMWEKRVAVVATLYFIKKKVFEPTCGIVLKNLQHPHDLMHKANGWMLREMGKQDENYLLSFIKKHYFDMPRTTLRYAIEKLDTAERKEILNWKKT